jgi:hypothetical protein
VSSSFHNGCPSLYLTVLTVLSYPFILRFSSGAVKRSRLEKLEPSISYETFVEDLDPGDSFTTTLTELLVRVRPCCLSPCTLTVNRGLHCRKWQSAVNDKQPTVGLYPIAQPRACAPSPHHSVFIATVLDAVSLLIVRSISPITSRLTRWTSMMITTVSRV